MQLAGKELRSRLCGPVLIRRRVDGELTARRRGCALDRGAVQNSGIDRGASAADGLEVEVVPVNLHEHEAAILIESLVEKLVLIDIPFPELSAGAGNEILNPLLGFDA